jgi:hypothetical protein
LAAEAKRFDEAIDELDRQLAVQEGELARNPLKQRWAFGRWEHAGVSAGCGQLARSLLNCLHIRLLSWYL